MSSVYNTITVGRYKIIYRRSLWINYWYDKPSHNTRSNLVLMYLMYIIVKNCFVLNDDKSIRHQNCKEGIVFIREHSRGEMYGQV